MRLPTAKILLVLVLTPPLLSACSGTGKGTPAKPTATATATPSATARLTAADGSDVAACREARCQILLSGTADVPLDPTFQFSKFIVGYASPNRVTFEIGRKGSTEVHSVITGTGYLSLAYGVTVTVEKIDATGAVLRFTPKAESIEAHRGSGTEGFTLYESGD